MRYYFSVPIRLVCLIALFIPSVLSAQDYRPGYIIKSNMDSLSGFVEYATEKKNSMYCMFRATRKSESVKFTPNDLSSFGFYSDKQYESMQVPGAANNNRVFVKVLAKGPLQLYQHQKEFLVRKDSLILLPAPKSTMVETPQGMRSKNDSRYKGLLNFMVADCQLSANEIKYSEYDLTNLAINYNRCKGVEPLFRKQKPIFRADYIAFGGYTQSNFELTGNHTIPFNTSNTVTGGLGVELSSPRIFDRIYLTIDFSYVKCFYQAYYEYEDGYEFVREDITMDLTSIKMPIGFRYNFMKDTNTPYIKAGLLMSFLTQSDITLNQERELFGEITTISQSDAVTELQKVPKGYWVSVGYNRRFYKNLQLFVEVRYDKGEGFIGTPVQSFSNMSNLNFMLGIRF